MVNCKNCGAPLSLNEAYCPHCGTPNPEAQEHLRKLAALDNQFHKAQDEVRDEVKKSRKGYGVLVILVMVLLANLALIPLHMASYEIADRIRLSSAMTDEEIRTKLDSFLKNEEFAELYLFTNKYDLSYSDFREYTRTAYLASYYVHFIEDVTNYLYNPDPYSDPLVRACQEIADFKSEYTNYLRWADEDEDTSYAEQLNRDFDAAVKEYLKLTDEDLKEAENMTSSALLVRVNERLNNEDK